MITIENAIQQIIQTVPGAPILGTVDTVKTGDPSQPVRGIVTTFLATAAVIREAARLGANLIITHEPTFYNHRDEIGFLENDPVYQAKHRLIDEHQIVIWRFHDYWHTHRPDGILTGTLRRLNWEARVDPANPFEVNLLPIALQDLATELKTKLGVSFVRFIGDPRQVCRRAALCLGAYDWQTHVRLLNGKDIDVLIVGEINEWETSEYVRDALELGMSKALIIAGHAPSEEPGMAYLAEWLRPRFPGIPIQHVPAGSPFQLV